MKKIHRRRLAGCLLAFAAWPAFAALREEESNLPVGVLASDGSRVVQDIRVTTWSDDANPRPAPIVVLNHGRLSTAAERQAMPRARYSQAAAFFVGRGFIVVVPTRLGYGAGGGPDVENPGSCDAPDFARGADAAAEQIAQALAAARRRPDAAQDRAVVVGHSFGGLATLDMVSRRPAGVQAFVNFAGGAGGNAKDRPRQPCAMDRLQAQIRHYGETSRIPSLWIYAENDDYFGTEHPQEWLAAYREAGGQGEFIQAPPVAEPGHLYFNRAVADWVPGVGAFLDAQGFQETPHAGGNGARAADK